jgi:cellulose synthase/poly-beta-1,6-N-acetylglucosamine synthase-like glycosyltransferase
MHMLRFVEHINWAIAVLLTVAYLYQGFYLLVGLVRRRRREKDVPCRLHRYAAVIAARNEQAVIGELIESLLAQNYPRRLLDVYVVADNCTDDTARAARKAGAFVYERFDQVHKGKGYAMDYLFRRLKTEGRDGYDAYLVFDADNLVDPNFVAEMNKVFDKGYDAVTCYRNSKNFGDNWISAGYSVWFLREARFLNFPRMLLGTNCAVSGTGFLVSAALIRENGGWPFHLLTEDIQFSVHCAVQGKRIGYCDKAVVYDEQPTTFRQSWDQRLRWSKGFYQVDGKYGLPLLRGCLRPGRRGSSCYDMLMTVAPGMLLTVLLLVFNAVILTACLTQPPYWADRIFDTTVEFILGALVNFYVGLFLYGLITVLSEWRHINARWFQKLGYLITFPLFMFTYIPISLAALVRRVEWKPIYHNATKGLRQAG